MSDTPKSFEELQAHMLENSDFAAMGITEYGRTVWNAALASLTPQTAPGSDDEWSKLEAACDDRTGYLLPPKYRQPVLRLIAAARQAASPEARPDVSEGGEGELPAVPYDKHEREMLEVIDERDAAEEALSQAFYLITGEAAEWSNLFGHAEALETIDDAQKTLRESLREAIAQRDEARKGEERLQVQLAGCGVAATGWSTGDQRAAHGDYGWSPAYEDVLKLREHSWRCFHCGFFTLDEAQAAAHFGDRDDPEECKPLCKWWQRMDDGERASALQDIIQQLNEARALDKDLVEAEQTRWQKAIYGVLVKECGDSIDGGGCDSGDSLDFTLSEVTQGLALLSARAEAAEAKLAAASDFKPEEIERMKYVDHKGMTYRHGYNAAIDDVIARLRSLPSEPQIENRKAVENG